MDAIGPLVSEPLMPTGSTAKNLEHIETINGQSVRLVGLSMGLTVFLPIPFRDVAGSIRELFDHYLQLVPRTVFRWQNLGGTSGGYKPVSPRAFSTVESWLSLRRSYGSSCAIWLQDGPTKLGSGDNLFNLFGQDHANRPGDSGFLQILFPWNLPETMGLEPLVARIHQMLQHLPFHSGYLGYTLATSNLSTVRPYSSIIATKAYAAAQRYPGLEITKPHLENYEMETVLRPPSWLTFLSHPFIEKLGGEKELRGSLKGDFVLRPLEHGWSIQAGPMPRLGDRNRQEDVSQEQRALAQRLRPLLSDKPAVLFKDRAYEDTLSWMRRLAKDESP